MPRPFRLLSLPTGLLLLASCGDASGPGRTATECQESAPSILAEGEHLILDPAASRGCLGLPAAGSSGAEYLVAVVSANGQAEPSGVTGGFTLTGEGAPVAMVRGMARLGEAPPADEAAGFHAARRREEAALARTSTAMLRRPRLVRPPVVGGQRTFSVCASLACDGFVPVIATARTVGARVAVFLDDAVPAGGYTPAELDSLGVLFDQNLFAIDSVAFGGGPDVDGNGVVIVLLTDQVNALSNCQATNTIVRGYFSSRDLTGSPNSSSGEVIYALVPDPAVPQCFGKVFAQAALGPTFVHELQHLISFHRHVLLGGGQPEESWLNEGLSHFAEELAGRQLPPALCRDANCLNQYAAANIRNAFGYLASPASWYLVFPGSSTGQLAERGAAWLFVRWLLDRSETDPLLATDLTRRLTGADRPGGLALRGGANIEAALQPTAPGVSFATLAGRWHLSNWTARLDGFSEPSGWLRYRSWNLPQVFDQLMPGPYPLAPDSTDGAAYRSAGTLRGGSATYLRVVQPADAPALALSLSTRNSAALSARIVVLRVR